MFTWSSFSKNSQRYVVVPSLDLRLGWRPASGPPLDSLEVFFFFIFKLCWKFTKGWKGLESSHEEDVGMKEGGLEVRRWERREEGGKEERREGWRPRYPNTVWRCSATKIMILSMLQQRNHFILKILISSRYICSMYALSTIKLNLSTGVPENETKYSHVLEYD